MPNYRNKNKNRKNKNRNKKNANKTQNQNNANEQNEPDESIADAKCGDNLETPTLTTDSSAKASISREPASIAKNNCNDALNSDAHENEIDGSTTTKTTTNSGDDTVSLELSCEPGEGHLSMGATNSQMTSVSDTDRNFNFDLTNDKKREAKSTTNNVANGKVIVHRLIQEQPNQEDNKICTVDKGKGKENEDHNQESKHSNEISARKLQETARVIIHRVEVEEPSDVENENVDFQIGYRVQSPEDTSCDRGKIEKQSEPLIQEISDECSGDYNDNLPIISEAESEPEVVEDKSLDDKDTVNSEDETAYKDDSKSQPSQETSAKQRVIENRVAIGNHFLPQLLYPRYLDSIVEENSDSNDTRSECSESFSIHSDETKTKNLNAVFPKSNLDFSKTRKHGPLPKMSTKTGLIREEPIAMIVETRLVEQTPAEESCSTLSSMHTAKAEDAEVVYINSASSSRSDLMDLESEEDTLTQSTVDLDTDVKEVFTKPSDIMSAQRDSTPTNQTDDTDLKIFKFENNNLDESSSTDDRSEEFECTQCEILENMLSSLTDALSSGHEETRNICHAEICEDLQSFATDTLDSKESTSTDSNSLRANRIVDPTNVLIENSEMNNVRDIINNKNVSNTPLTTSSILQSDLRDSQSEATNTNEIISHEEPAPYPATPQLPSQLDIPELLTQTESQSKFTNSSSLTRQESADSHYSDSTNHSQCTAIHMGASSISDFDMSPSISDIGICAATEGISFPNTETDSEYYDNKSDETIKKLRLLCTETLASMPYGEEVLEELATVAHNISQQGTKSVDSKSQMPFPLPELPHINDLQLSVSSKSNINTIEKHPSKLNTNLRSPSPPPVPEPPSKYDSWLALPTDSNPKLLVCLSPSQQSYINQNPLAIDNKPDQLLDDHQKFIGRRGYHEYSIDEIDAMNSEKIGEQQILETAAIMKKLRKSLTPPPVPPPPVPSKSSETAAKAQSQKKATTNNNSTSFNNMKEHTPAAGAAAAAASSTSASLKYGEENKHRLLAIIHGTNEFKQIQTPKTSSLENNTRQTTKEQGEALQPKSIADTTSRQIESIKTTSNNKYMEESKRSLAEVEENLLKNSSEEKKIQYNNLTTQANNNSNMNSVESEIAKLFPSIGHTNIFDGSHKRFSNIESSNAGPYCSQILSTQPKRYSNIETRSYESKKQIENGQVIYDSSNSCHEIRADGDKDDIPAAQIPLRDHAKMHASESNQYQPTNSFEEHKPKTTSNEDEIMSALKLNTESSTTVDAPFVLREKHQDNFSNSEISEENDESRININRLHGEKITLNTDIRDTYEEFRQRAKAAANAIPLTPSSFATTPTAAATPTASTTTEEKLKKSSFNCDHEKLFKDFDDLSKQLNMELESSKARKELHAKSTSLYDLSRAQSQSKKQIEDLKRQRQEHMKELEQEIEKSAKSRHFKKLTRHEPYFSGQERSNTKNVSSFNIPINVENDGTLHKTYNIPVEIEGSFNTGTAQDAIGENNSRFRRAKSMFDISDSTMPVRHQRNVSINREPQPADNDNWSRYVNDFGSSENITKPFAREVEICYQRQRPNTIRAPRLSFSTNDLSMSSPNYDNISAYKARRTHAPMLTQTSQKRRPQYLSCHSMIERDPNPTYISTTSRRGISPAPPALQPSHEPREREMLQRRASLPREIHEKQLKYITSKEEELKTEFERLENERRRLLEEMNQSQSFSVPVQNRSGREYNRTISKLPTLTEDEVFRQQMAEEWLKKVAEREERRLHKIIRISKVNEHDGHNSNADISEEFLNRVKERRSKLAMPSDSDWESGAESHPLVQGHTSETEDAATVKILEGKSQADLKDLPKHLREFAKFSNQKFENLDNEQREVHEEEEQRREATNNSLSTALKKSSIIKTVKISRVPGKLDEIVPKTAHDHHPANAVDASFRQAFADTTDHFTRTKPMAITPQCPPSLNKLPVTFGEMFATSPFKSRIYEEFNNYWQCFGNT